MTEFDHYFDNASQVSFNLEVSNPVTGELFIIQEDNSQEADCRRMTNLCFATDVLTVMQQAAELEGTLRDKGMTQSRIDQKVGYGRALYRLMREGYDVNGVLPEIASQPHATNAQVGTGGRSGRHYADGQSAAANDYRD